MRSFNTHKRPHTSVAMGWLRLVGSLKLEVSTVKEPYKRDPWTHKMRSFNTHKRPNNSTECMGRCKLRADLEPHKRDMLTHRRNQRRLRRDLTTDTENTQKRPLGWLRLVGSLKLQVSFAEYHLFYRALLQKRPEEPLIVSYNHSHPIPQLLWGG